MTLVKILDRLYLGDAMDASDVDALRRNDIRFVLNCAGEHDDDLPEDFITEKLILDDMYAADMKEVGKGIAFIARCIIHGKVLVHCKVGVSRSPAIIIAYLLFSGFGLDDALEMVESAKLSVKPNPQIMMELRNIQNRWNDPTRRKLNG